MDLLFIVVLTNYLIPRATDARKITWSRIHVLAKLVTHESECKRLFGPNNWDQSFINGTVVECIDKCGANSQRANYLVDAHFSVVGEVTKVATVSIRSVKNGVFVGEGILPPPELLSLQVTGRHQKVMTQMVVRQ